MNKHLVVDEQELVNYARTAVLAMIAAGLFGFIAGILVRGMFFCGS